MTKNLEIIKYGKDFIFRGSLVRNFSGINQESANIAILEIKPNTTIKARLFRSKNAAMHFYRSFKREFRKNYLFVYVRKNNYYYCCHSENDFRLDFCFKDDKIKFINN